MRVCCAVGSHRQIVKADGLEAVGAKHEHPSVYTYYQLLSYAEHGTKALSPFHPQTRARANRDRPP